MPRTIPEGRWVLGWKRLLVWRAAELRIPVPPAFAVTGFRRFRWDGPAMALAKEVRAKARVKQGTGTTPGQLDGPLRAYLKGARVPTKATTAPPMRRIGGVPNQGPFSPGQPSYFVVHTTSGYGTPETLAKGFAADGLGVQWAVGVDGEIGCYCPGLHTYHVGPQNWQCEGVELIGWAVGEAEPHVSAGVPGSLGSHHVWTREDWLEHRDDQLSAVAWLLAFRAHKQLGFPLVRASSGDARGFVGAHGVVGHINVPGNDHVDPGPGWPWDVVLGRARTYAAHGVPAVLAERLARASAR